MSPEIYIYLYIYAFALQKYCNRIPTRYSQSYIYIVLNVYLLVMRTLYVIVQ